MADPTPPPSPIEAAVLSLNAKIDALTEEVNNLLINNSGYSSPYNSNTLPPPPPPPPPLQPPHRPHMKLEVPKFDGQDAIIWIFKINQFFEFHATPEKDRLTIASFYMEGPALSWYQWMSRNQLINSWHDFLLTLETRFAPSYYDDPRGALFKLTQTGTVNHYLHEFECIANRVVGLPHPFLLSCFVSGLSPEIRREVQAFQPLSLPHATALAKIQEDKINDRRRAFRPKTPFPSASTSNPSPQTLPTTNPTPITNPPKVNFKKLTQEELISRRERNLCYNCNEKFIPGHRCKGRFFLLISEEDENNPTADLTPPPTIEAPDTPPSPDSDLTAQLSLHAMSGTTQHNNIRFTGTISNTPVTVLVDGGSTHNFIQTRIAKFIGLPLTPTTTPLCVIVGSGDTIACTHKSSAFNLSIQGQTFQVELYSLPLSGA